MIAVFVVEVIAMRISVLLAVFFTLTLLFTGCASDTSKKEKPGGTTTSGQKSAPEKPAKPSEGS